MNLGRAPRERIRRVLLNAAALLAACMALAPMAHPSPAAAVPPSPYVPPSTDPAPPPGIEGDYLRVYQTRELTPAARLAAGEAASAARAEAYVLDSGTIGLKRLIRNGRVLSAARPGYRFPVGMSAIAVGDARSLYGFTIARALSRGQVVMSARSATRRGAQVGDEVQLYGWNRANRIARVGAISDAIQSELLMSTSFARSLGVRRNGYMIISGFSDRAEILEALESRSGGLGRYRAIGNWMVAPADDTLSSEGMKEALGEFAIRGAGSIGVDPEWRKENLTTVRWRIGNRYVYKTCHRIVAAASKAVFDEISDAGLDRFIDVRVTQSTGGCYLAREVRSIGSTSGRSISVHTWGGAIDINTSDNCLGCRPVLPCEIVQIFRAHGFAWGGNFLTADGMHFEWVGEPRDKTPTRPGEFCPIDGPEPSNVASAESGG